MININRSDLQSALERASRVAVQKSPLVQLGHVAIKLEGKVLTYQATDQKITLTGTLEASGKDCAFTCNARDLLAAVQSLQGDTVKLAPKADHVAVTGDGKRSFKVRALAYADYPECSAPPAEFLRLPYEIVGAIQRVAFSAAEERDDRDYLRSIRVVSDGHNVSAIAADGKRATRCVIDTETAEFATTIPLGAAKLLVEMAGADGFEFYGPTGAVWFRFGPIVVECRAHMQPYPPMDQIFSAKPDHSVEFDAKALADAVNAVKRVDHEGDVSFSFTGSALRIESQGSDGYAIDELECDGAKAEFGMNSRFLIEALKVASPTVTLGYSGDLAPVILSSPGWSAVMMPLRLEQVRSKAKL